MELKQSTYAIEHAISFREFKYYRLYTPTCALDNQKLRNQFFSLESREILFSNV